MSSIRRTRKFLTAALAAIAAALVLLPASAVAAVQHYGTTSVTISPSAAQAFKSLGLTVSAYGDTTVSGGAFDFPIATSPAVALKTGIIKHSGGLTLSAGGSVVILTHPWIDLANDTLSVQIDGGAETTVAGLSLADATFTYGSGTLSVGPATASLNALGASLIDAEFGAGAVKAGLVLGQGTLTYTSGL